MGEEISSSEYVYRGKILNLRVDQVRSGSSTVVREIVEHRGAVAIVAMDDQARVLLVKQYRSAAKQEMMEIPAGTLEPGEDPSACAPRELEEETGYRAAEWQELGSFYSSPGFSTEKMVLYLARGLTLFTPSPEEDEQISVHAIPLAESLAMIDRGEISDAKTIVGLLRVWRHLYAHDQT